MIAQRRGKSRVDVPALLGRLRIDAKAKGRALWAPCPLPSHEDRGPSWSIVDALGNPKHGFWHCFGCGEGGGPRALVREVLGYGRCECRPRTTCEPCRKAAEFLKGAPVVEQSAATPIVELVSPRGDRVLRLPDGVESGPLEKWPSVFRRYVEKRGITPEQVERWSLGYAVAGRLEMRLVIPVHDEHGALLSYAARTLIGAEERYMTPLRSDGLRPGAIFGRRCWPPAMPSGRLPGVLVVAEGGLDALAVERALGGGSVAAVMGSDPGPAEVGRLSRFERVVIASDGDPAGDKLAHILGGKLSARCAVARAELPRGADPASLPERDLAACLSPALEAVLRADVDPDPDRPPF